MPKLTLGIRPYTITDFLTAVSVGCEVDIDVQICVPEAKASSESLPPSPEVDENEQVLSAPITRGYIFSLAVECLEKFSRVSGHLVSILNGDKPLPRIPVSSIDGKNTFLIKFLASQGLSLSAGEEKRVISSRSLVAASVILAALRAGDISNANEASIGLSAETLKLYLDFGLDFERPFSQSFAQSVLNLSMLTTGSPSVLVKPPKKRNPLSALPKWCGSVRDVTDNARKNALILLNDSSPCFSTMKSQLHLIYLSLVEVIQRGSIRLSAVSKELKAGNDKTKEAEELVSKTQNISSQLETSLPDVVNEDLTALLSTSLSVHSLIDVAATLLSSELVTNLQSIEVSDRKKIAAHEEKVKRQKEREAEMAKKGGADDDKKKKRKESKKKNNKKDAKDPGVKLGKGNKITRTFWREVAMEETKEDAAQPTFNPSKLQASLESATFRDVFEAATAPESSKPKVAKGTRDATPAMMAVRRKMLNKIEDIYRKHGAVAIDTPIFELKSTLMGKYGEDSKLIYELADQGGELLALRYDLTVPFARYIGLRGIDKIKRFHIGKVYRRDQPQMNKGRFREFFQADLDIAGEYPDMVADAEVLTVLSEILNALDLKFIVKLNHRGILDGVMDFCGVPAEKFRPICSAIDKLDKMSWEDVKDEMVNVKGLNEAVADRLGKWVKFKGHPNELLKKLREEKDFCSHKMIGGALKKLETLFSYLDAFGTLDSFSFDLSLARGLDYYTGAIYEAVLTDTDAVGSVAAGGRYDKLVGMFSNKDVPCVGVSIGVERLLAICEERERAKTGGIREKDVDVLVVTLDKLPLVERMRLAGELWAEDVAAEYQTKLNLDIASQLTYADETFIPFVVFMGANEKESKTVTVRNVETKEQTEVKREDMAKYIKAELAKK